MLVIGRSLIWGDNCNIMVGNRNRNINRPKEIRVVNRNRRRRDKSNRKFTKRAGTTIGTLAIALTRTIGITGTGLKNS